PDDTGFVNFGTFTVASGGMVVRTFTVRNIGNTNLTLGAPTISSPAFIVTSGLGSTSLAPGTSTSFALGFRTGTIGVFSAEVSFTTNDSDENPFNFTVFGGVNFTSSAPMIRGESLTRQVDESGVATLRGHLVDPDPLDDLFLSIDWGDGSPTETDNVG